MAYISVKDFATSLAVKLRTFLVNTDENVTVHGLVDSANGEILGTKTEAKSTATDATSVSIMQVLKQISASVQALVTGRTSRWLAATNGLLTANPVLLIGGSGNTSGLDGLANGSAATGSAALSQSNTGGALQGYIYYLSGDAAWTPVGAGACLSGWFLKSADGGSTFESPQNTPSTSVPALSRPPDFIVPLDLVATGTGGQRKYAPGLVDVPSVPFKTVIQNNGGATTGDTTATHAGVYLVPVGATL